MSRTPARFREAEIARAVRGVRAAGLNVAAIEVDASGKIIILTGKRSDTNSAVDASDVVAERLARMGAAGGKR